MAKQFKVEVEVNGGNIMGAAMLAAGAFWNLGAVVAQEARVTVAEKTPVIKATIRDYAQMGREAADEKAASFLNSLATKLQAAADNMKQQ